MNLENLKSKLLELIPYILIIIGVVLIRSYLYTPIKVNGTSMDPTLKQNDLMILSKIGLKSGLNRWDVVVVKEDSKYIIKRVIGLPGESVAYIDGKLYINKKNVEDNYSKSKTNDFNEIYLSDDEYFVMGDNRIVSADSRIIGPIKKDQILGKTSFRFFPFNKIGNIEWILI